MIITEPICMNCKHYNIETNTCAAFAPDDIPDEIIVGDNDHSKPLEDQKNDIVFTPIENESK